MQIFPKQAFITCKAIYAMGGSGFGNQTIEKG